MRRLVSLSAALAITCAASPAFAAPRVSVEPPRVVLGDTPSVRIRVEPDSDELRAAASAGTLVDEGEADGARVFVWTPPEITFPSTGVLLFWSASSASPDVAVVRIPLLGKTTLEMDTEPAAEVRVTVGGSQFGPVKANARGRVRVPIAVAPGVTSAQVLARSGGQQTSRTVPLEVPVTHPFAVAAGPEPLPADGGWLLVAGARPGADKAAQVRAEGARFDRARSDDATEYRLVPEADRKAPVVVTVSARDESTVRAVVPVAGGDPVPGAPRPPARHARLVPHAMFGGFFGGGANAGPALEVGVAYPLPFWSRRVSAEFSAGVRQSAFSVTAGTLGRADASLLAFPLSAGLRARLFERSALAVDARAGAGALPFRHALSTGFQEDRSDAGLGFVAFAAAQGLYRLGPVEALLEVRGSFAQARSPRVMARPGGLIVSLGARWLP